MRSNKNSTTVHLSSGQDGEEQAERPHSPASMGVCAGGKAATVRDAGDDRFDQKRKRKFGNQSEAREGNAARGEPHECDNNLQDSSLGDGGSSGTAHFLAHQWLHLGVK